MTLWISCQMALSKNLFHKDGKKRAQHLRVFCVWRCDHQQEHDWLGTTLWGSIVFGIAGKDGCIEGWALTGNDGQCSIGSGLNCSTWAVLLAKLTLKRKKSWLLHLLFHKFERVLIQNGGEDLNFCVRCFFSWLSAFYEPDCFVVQGEKNPSQIEIILLRIELLIKTNPIF